MPYSVIIDNEVLDFRFTKPTKAKYIHNFYVGDIFVGQLFDMKSGWSAVAHYKYDPIGPVDGFRTRLDAAEYLLKVTGLLHNSSIT